MQIPTYALADRFYGRVQRVNLQGFFSIGPGLNYFGGTHIKAASTCRLLPASCLVIIINSAVQRSTQIGSRHETIGSHVQYYLNISDDEQICLSVSTSEVYQLEDGVTDWASLWWVWRSRQQPGSCNFLVMNSLCGKVNAMTTPWWMSLTSN